MRLLPIPMTPDEVRSQQTKWCHRDKRVLGLLAEDGASLMQVQAAMSVKRTLGALARRIKRQHPASRAAKGKEVLGILTAARLENFVRRAEKLEVAGVPIRRTKYGFCQADWPKSTWFGRKRLTEKAMAR